MELNGRWKEMGTYGYEKVSDAAVIVSTNGEYILAGVTVFLLSTLAFIGWRTWKLGEGYREMVKSSLATEQRMMADRLTCLLLELVDKGKLTPERAYFWNKKLGLSLDLHDMIPRIGVKKLKERLKRKRYSSNPDSIADLQSEVTPAPLPDAVIVADEDLKPHSVQKEKANVVGLFKPGSAAA